ncbi:hypothetical protein [Limosilactobacillus panis]|uniref:Uncharacterized protein n=1 Tax=Limosilactobacillus panis TaxID=47493 RepID=A0ABT7VL01_9LACO|nr:hypothetical protein [Limosilactobacillus panis]MDM8333417.1 hypothetical protein [Limosilactobacillus panis]
MAFSPFQTGKSYHIEPVPVKGRQRLFEVPDHLIKPVSWERDGQTNEQEKHEWWANVYLPLIENK